MKFFSMSKLESAEMFAKTKHAGMTRKDGISPYFAHPESVVSYLKSLGVTDEDVLCSGWLHDTIEDTDTTFDELYERFGKKVAVLVSTLSKDRKLPKKERERLYVDQLKNAPLEAKIIKLCDISANLKDLANSKISKNQRKKRRTSQKWAKACNHLNFFFLQISIHILLPNLLLQIHLYYSI